MIKKFDKNIIKIVNISLALLIVSLAVMIYKSLNGSTILFPEKIPEVYIFKQDYSPGKPKINRPIPREINFREQQLLVLARQEISDDGKKDFFDLIQNEAKESEIVDIRTCDHADPMVLKLKLNQQFTIKNSDNINHAIKIDPQNIYDIKAGESKKFKAKFSNGPGVYGYVCDQYDGLIGFLYVDY